MPSPFPAPASDSASVPTNLPGAVLFQMLDGISTAVYVKDRHHQWIFANARCCQLLGRSPQQILGLSDPNFFSAEQAQHLKTLDEAAFQGQLPPPHPLTVADTTGQAHILNRRVQLAAEATVLISFLESTAGAPTSTPIPTAPLWNTPQFLALLSNVPAMIYQFCLHPDGTTTFPFVSPGAFEVYGVSPETIQANPQVILAGIHPLDRPSFDAAMAASARSLSSWRWEGRYYKPTGELRWLQTAARPQATPGGSIVWDGLLMDITNRKQAEAATLERAVMEQALADNETRFRTITATIPGALFQLRTQGEHWQVDYVSDRFQDIVGLTPAEAVADIQSFLARVHPGDRERLKHTVDEAIAQTSPWSFEGRILTSEGETRWWRGDAMPVREPQGVVLFCGVMMDITTRRMIEEAYRESEQRLRMALEISRMAVWTWELATDQMTWTAGAETLFGHNGSFCNTFATYLQQVYPADQARLQETIHHTLETGKDYQIEYRMTLPEGGLRWVGAQGGVWRDRDGLLIGLAGMVVDITERKTAANALEKSEKRYRTLLENLPGAVYRYQANEQWTTLFQSEAISRITGYPAHHPIHKSGTALIHPDDLDRVMAETQAAIAQQQPFDLEYRILHADGTFRWVQDKGQPVLDESGQVTLVDGVLNDVTRRKESETRLRELAQREALINRISSQIRESLRLESILQATVQSIRRQLETDRVVIYRFSEGWQGQVVVEDVAPPWASTIGEMGTDTCFPKGYANYYQSGRVRAIDDIQTDTALDDCHRDYLASLQVRANLIVPILLKKNLWGLLIAHECQGPRRWSGSEIELLLSLAGQVGVAIGQADLYQQATENADRARKQAEDLEATLDELRRTQAQLVQNEKMSSLGQLVAGVAHEINNPVTFIDGNLNHAWEYAQDLLELIGLYQRSLPEPPEDLAEAILKIDLDFLMQDFPKLLESMRVGADRIKTIVTSLRTFSRMDEAEIKPVDIHDGLDSTLMILQSRLKANGDRPEIQLVQDYGDLPEVECYAGQLNQVFMNLISNAIDALEEQLNQGTAIAPPQITIRTAVVDPHNVTITIADNGPGIPDAVKQRIFEPFYTTKPVGKGTGIGLSISYQIITERHQGTLACDAEPGKGTLFTITIPQTQGTT